MEKDVLASKSQCLAWLEQDVVPSCMGFPHVNSGLIQNSSVCDEILKQKVENVFELDCSEIDDSNHSILDNTGFLLRF